MSTGLTCFPVESRGITQYFLWIKPFNRRPRYQSRRIRSSALNMPFNYDDYEIKISQMEPWELAAEKQKYTRSASGSAVGGVASFLLGPFAPIGMALSASTAANAGIKLKMINDEMRSRDVYARTRCRDIFGGAAISAATVGLGHGVTHIANQAITHATHHALTHGQHALTHYPGHSTEKRAEHVIERALEKHTGSGAITASTGLHRICDVCYEVSMFSSLA
jgi:hypothetical protein